MKWNTTHIDHLKRKALKLTHIQYAVLDFIYWMQNWRNNSVDGYCKLSMGAIAENLCLSKDTVRTVVSALEEKDLIKMAYPFEVEEMIEKGFKVKDSEKESLRRVTNRVEDIFDMNRDELLKEVHGMERSWRFTDVNYSVIRNIVKSGFKLKLSHFCFLDYIRQSQASDSFGEIGWCDLSYSTIARVMDITEDGARKIVGKVGTFLVFDESKGFRVSDVFNGFFLEGAESDTTKKESVKKAAVNDSVVNSEVHAEVLWRLDNAFGANQLRDIFGEDADLVAEKNYLAEQWIESGEKELVPHPKSGRSTNWKYQNCLKGFRRWVETYARERSKTPVKDRKLVTSHKAREMELDLLRKTATAYGKPTMHYWKGREWKLDEEALRSYANQQKFSVDEKRKMLVYACIGGLAADFNFDLNQFMREWIDPVKMKDALNDWDFKAHAGRPREFDRYPPRYVGLPKPKGVNDENWRVYMPKDYWKQHDIDNPPQYCYDRNGELTEISWK